MSVAESMRREWDARADKNAFYYIASWRTDWDIDGFLKSGEEDYQQLVAPVLDRFAFSPEGKSMLELGCGAGRMTHSFTSRFGNVLAFDVSEQMLDRARVLLKKTQNVSFFLGDGTSLAAADESVDFAFSYLVLQHLPSEQLVLSYVREILRVLRPGGLCLLQFNGMKRPTMNWKGQFAWGVIDALWDLRFRRGSRALARLLGFDPEMGGKTWHGTAMESAPVVEAVLAAGGTVLDVRGEGSARVWCCARKNDISSDSASSD